ncbi:MAG TPA: carbonic anhydrase [Miltoncostaea sp.]|nr:carbonic anhydrase [Miltoncostaea sp.]
MAFTERLLDSVSEHALPVEPAARPRLGVAVLTCMDPRVDPLAALGLRREDAHVLRNAGGMVTTDVLESLAISQRALGTREIVVLHHTRCAGLDARGGGHGPEASVREAVRRLIAARQLPHRDGIRGVLLDTGTGRVREIAAPRRHGYEHAHAHRHPAAARHAHHHHPAPDDHHCAWCHRPFAPTGRSRWRPPTRYCSDLCRLAARRAHALRH